MAGGPAELSTAWTEGLGCRQGSHHISRHRISQVFSPSALGFAILVTGRLCTEPNSRPQRGLCLAGDAPGPAGGHLDPGTAPQFIYSSVRWSEWLVRVSALLFNEEERRLQ